MKIKRDTTMFLKRVSVTHPFRFLRMNYEAIVYYLCDVNLFESDLFLKVRGPPMEKKSSISHVFIQNELLHQPIRLTMKYK